MELKHKSFQVEHLKVLSAEEGIVECYTSVFGNVDSYNERIIAGAFANSLKRKLPKGVWMHKWDEPVAKTLEAEEIHAGDPRLPDSIKHLGGLYIKGQFNLGTQRGRDAFSDVSFGTVDEYSIGYSVQKASPNPDGVLDLLELNLYEWSPVLVGANPATLTVGVKDALPAKRKFSEHMESVLATNSEFAKRAKSIQELRAKEGRVLSASNREKLKAHVSGLAECMKTIQDILDQTEPAKQETQEVTTLTPERKAHLRNELASILP